MSIELGSGKNRFEKRLNQITIVALKENRFFPIYFEYENGPVEVQIVQATKTELRGEKVKGYLFAVKTTKGLFELELDAVKHTWKIVGKLKDIGKK